MSQHTLTGEAYDALKRLLDRVLTLSPTGEIGDGMVATLKQEADEIQKALNMNLRPPLEPTYYRDVKPGEFFLIHHASGMSLMHQDDEDKNWEGTYTVSGNILVRPRPRSLTTSSFVRLEHGKLVEIVTRERAATLVRTGLVVLHHLCKNRVQRED